MKIFDWVGAWIDKLDAKIFGKEGYQPLAGEGFILSLKVGIGVGVAIFIAQMVDRLGTAQQWVAAIGGLLILAAMVMRTLPNFQGDQLSVGGKIGYGFFCLFLAGIAFQLAAWIVMLIIIILVLWLVLTFATGNKPKKGVRLEYEDGTTEDKSVHTDILGNEVVELRDGTLAKLDDLPEK